MGNILRALHRARLQILTVGLVYLLSVLVGAVFRPDPAYKDSRKLMGYPVEALRDVARVYALVVPLFLIASLWEFLSSWN
ncbi:MAG: hypothetical protein ABR951_03695 [Candidatus Aminicenantales bacterium]|jgi:hypothetical protein